MRVHFIAIGGSAMHNLALALHHKGYKVTGSDDAIFDPAKTRLESYGLLPKEMGWFPEKLSKDIDAIILGMHAKKDNPELIKAQELGLSIYSYPEFLFNQAQEKTRVVIGGSHGKTTITSMILHVLHALNREMDYMVGAQLEGFDTMVKITPDSEYMILEGDEYLSSPIDLRPKFLWYKPNIALISGIAWDHINVFPTFDDYTKQFELFANTITPGGSLVYNEEDEEVCKVIERIETPVKLFPYKTPKYYIENGKTFLITDEGEVPLQVFGKHNLLNMEGARNICHLLGVTDAEFYEAIMSFTGASKRLELYQEKPNRIVYKDFAHAPSKVTSTLHSVREQFPNHTLFAILELHTYSSLNPEFLQQYKGALDAADVAVVYYNEEALRIKRMEPIDENVIKQSFDNPSLNVFDTTESLERFLSDEIENCKDTQTVFLMMSSGNYGKLNWEKIFT